MVNYENLLVISTVELFRFESMIVRTRLLACFFPRSFVTRIDYIKFQKSPLPRRVIIK